ncbi:helix-turn-helix transcriptional regulator [Halocynthiibacter namhaensis]|uniref:helix-turn-helix transcriptional regulator n=1 Tax=Halocynthiibacter namhaensis TaxID=1290553 RepID=UPI000579305E|nr:helix-turn-helix transcriptional regulator [Halocynthiibacter namhaensis]
MPTLDQIGTTLMEIHELPAKVPFHDFQDAALQVVKRILPFDASWWGLVSGLEIHTATRFDLPEGYRSHWNRISEHDPIASASLGNPFTTVIFNQPDLAPHKVISEFLGTYGIRHVLCTSTKQRDLGLYAFLSLYRRDAMFNEEERMLNQVLVPHLLHALGQSWRGSLEQSLHRLNGEPDIQAAAICDKRGLILSSEASFSNVIRREWPSWHGPNLPPPLIKSLTSKDYVGVHLQVRFDAVSGLYLLRLSERDPISDLTQRETEVAQLFATGHTYKQVAQRLEIAPTTVRHYLRNVYGKLHISDKATLATLLARSSGR